MAPGDVIINVGVVVCFFLLLLLLFGGDTCHFSNFRFFTPLHASERSLYINEPWVYRYVDEEAMVLVSRPDDTWTVDDRWITGLGDRDPDQTPQTAPGHRQNRRSSVFALAGSGSREALGQTGDWDFLWFVGSKKGTSPHYKFHVSGVVRMEMDLFSHA